MQNVPDSQQGPPDLFDAIEETEDTRGPCPESGIYYNVPFEEYALWDAINGSVLFDAKYSPKHLRSAIDRQSNTDTRDRKFGRATHCRLLEPERYHAEYLIATPCKGIIKSGERKGQECGKRGSLYDGETWFCGTHKKEGCEEPEDYIDQEESLRIEMLAQEVYSDPAVNLIRQKGGFETSIVWEMSGVRCKARLDKYAPKPKEGRDRPAIITDIKKCQRGKGDQIPFSKQAADLGYVGKAAWYSDGIKALTGETPIFMWVVIEDKHPFAIAVYQALSWQIELGRTEYTSYLSSYINARESNHWAGYSEKVRGLIIPGWYEKLWSSEIR